MKLPIFSLLVIAFMIFFSCGKEDGKEMENKENNNDITVCTWEDSKVSDSDLWDKYIVEPLVTEEGCGCIGSGVVKYVEKEGKMVFIVYYGKGECDQWAYLVTCYDGDCKSKKTEKCKLKLDCEPGN